MHVKRKICELRVKMSQNVIFCVQKIFENLLFKIIFFLQNRAA